jgi:oligoribonuclease (3'-5' exoribonuclease)
MSVLLLWFDAETGGLDLHNDNVLEVAWTITDHNGLQLTPLRQHLTHLVPPGSDRPHVHPANSQDWRNRAPVLVQDMHEQSGLTSAYQRCYPHLVTTDAALLEESVRLDLDVAAETQRQRGGTPVTRAYLAGAGVSHFDHELLAIHTPKLGGRDGALHYRDIDVSVALCTLTGGDHEGSSTSLDDAVLTRTLQHIYEQTEALYDERHAAYLIDQIRWVTSTPDMIWTPEESAELERVLESEAAPHRAGPDVIRALALFRLLRGHPQALMINSGGQR